MADLSESGQAGALEIEITPAMVSAGVKAWGAWEDSSNPSLKQLVTRIYLAMKAHEEEPLPH